MNEQELESFEAELRAFQPAPTPPELLARLDAARPSALPPARPQATRRVGWPALSFWRWFAPATAFAVLALAFAIWQWPHGSPAGLEKAVKVTPSSPSPEIVEIDRELVSSYDAIAELSSGVPVRFNCQPWEDKFVFRDRLRGIAIERTTPRLEIVPVSFETY